MNHISIDIETFSSVDLKKSGLYKYVQSPDFQILLFAYSLNRDPVKIIDLAIGEIIPSPILDLLNSPNCIKHAFNAAFEWYCLNKFYRSPLDQWHCTMVHALYCGYPTSLAQVNEAMNIPEDKKKLSTGLALIRTFCNPCTPTKSNGRRTRTLPHHEPERWKLFKEYCKQDVISEMEVENRLSAFPVPEDEQNLWILDQLVNERGVMIDRQLVDGALYCDKISSERLTKEATEISGLDNPNSVSQLTKWLEKEIGSYIPNLQKDTVSHLISTTSNDKAKRMLEIRQELAKTSISKYTAMDEAVCDDDRIRGLVQFYGANRTGRWAGRIVQVQNLPRNYLSTLDLARWCIENKKLDAIKMIYGSVPDTLSQLIRTAFIPAPGYRLIVADFSAIEARVLAWLAGEDWVLDVFRSHGKIYEACASQMFGVPIELIVKGNDEYELRQKGKVATLALGYQGSVGALITMGALDMGLCEDELPEIVQRWRNANKRIVGLWYTLENTALKVMRTGEPAGVNNLILALEGDSNYTYFTVTLPSGRRLFYVNPFLQENKFDKVALWYWGLNQTTKKWETDSTYGGKLTENITQAIARDCLAVCMKRLAAKGYRIVFHVHDEVVIELPYGHGSLEEVCDIMGQPMPWAPGLPLKGDGFECEYYRKD